ncbi:alpha/beta-hydrolase [Abortiporus biennis]|nr:alpha/beta-hydrolase [Abortiporus biennis]
MFLCPTVVALSLYCSWAHAQGSVNNPVPVESSWPQDYPGKPSGDYSPQWQNYFQVTETLPNVTFPLSRNFAGNIAVNRAGHPNNTLFFWGFEHAQGSLTAASSDPWQIWLNGGPGSSSLLGFHFENGPIAIQPDYSIKENPFSWDKLVDTFWIDQPVGTGYSTVDSTGSAPNEDVIADDFVFPGLKNRPLYISGESYAGKYIPYLAKAWFGLSDPPTKLEKISMGDGCMGNQRVFQELPTVQVIETFPQLIGWDTEVLEYFREQSHLCGYDVTFTYPETKKYPTIDPFIPPSFGDGELLKAFASNRRTAVASAAKKKFNLLSTTERMTRKREERRQNWKRDLTGRPNGTLDTFYACGLLEELADYAVNFTFPWNITGFNGFDVYNIPDGTDPEPPLDAFVFLNTSATRAAIHAPTSKNWAAGVNLPWGGDGVDPSEPMVFLDELAANASSKGVGLLFFSGNNDALVPHRGTELVIQNMTFSGIQGFSRRPSTPWNDDNGNFAGVIHQERGVQYVLFDNAAHQVPLSKPQAAFKFLRDFILGNSTLGLVEAVDGIVSVIGGEVATLLQNGVLAGAQGIAVGSVLPDSTFAYPSATIAAWSQFITTATPSP